MPAVRLLPTFIGALTTVLSAYCKDVQPHAAVSSLSASSALSSCKWYTATAPRRFHSAADLTVRNALALVPKAAQQFVAATIRTAFAQPELEMARQTWHTVADVPGGECLHADTR